MDKKSISVPIHSVVDVITNSSTVIYTHARDGADKVAREMIQEILDLGGSTLSVDDLFDIRIVSDFTDGREFVEYDALETILIEELGITEPEYEDGMGWEKEEKIRKKFVEKHKDRIDKWLEGNPTRYEYPYVLPKLVITTKDGKETKLTAAIMSQLTESFESYN
jgi:hypothetical protein